MISLQNNSRIYLLGNSYLIKYSEKKFIKEKVVFDESTINVYQSEENNLKHNKILFIYLKKYAKKEISKRVVFLSKKYNFTINRIAVRDQSSRWGSCSSKKNINMNWRLIFAPIETLDYVIIHELCHTKEMNHSKNFWNLVESISPNWKENRDWLTQNSRNLLVEKLI